jgi:Domain of unknown function (DUF6431)
MSILDKIRAHEQEALSNIAPSDLRTCPKCQGHPDFFKAYDCRSRIFLAIEQGIVKKILSFLSRWKCPLCGKKFLYYPDYAIPFKRYVKDSLVNLSKQYLSDEKATYSEVVKADKMPIVYDDNEKEDRLEPSTVWRWLGYIGSLRQAIGKALLSLGSSEISEKIKKFPGGKYRSEQRKQLLIQAKTFFLIQEEFAQVSDFPKLEIGGFRF